MFNDAWIRQRLAEPGYRTPFEETRELHQCKYKELHEALELIPDEMKVDYCSAVCQCPQLVGTESDPIQFLRREEWNAWAAALRLVSYWKTRVETFAEKAFLPMTIDGSGAMNEEDIAMLKTGIRAVLPNDEEGRSVLVYDRFKCVNYINKFSREARNHNSFYLFHDLAENPKSQKEGIVFLAILHHDHIKGLSKSWFDMARNSMPIRIKSLYMVQAADIENQVDFLRGVVPFAHKFAGTHVGKQLVHVSGDSQEEILRKLEGYGLSRAGLPVSIGGEWEYSAWLSAAGLGSKLDQQSRLQGTESSDESEEDEDDDQTAATAEDTTLVDDPPQHDEAMERQRVKQMEEALSLLPDSSKAEYLEAKRRVPELVKRESDRIVFLRCEGHNAYKAAARIAKYWERRVALLGDRAFLPLDLSDPGAFSSEERDVLERGLLCLLPNDFDGSSVLLFQTDLLQCGAELSSKAKARALFYLAHVASQNRITVKDGVVALYAISVVRDRQHMAAAIDLMQSAMPIRTKASHLLCVKGKDSEGPIAQTLDIVKRHFLCRSPQPKVWVHVADEAAELQPKLEPFGLMREGVPEKVGGTWSVDELKQWWQERERIDRVLNSVGGAELRPKPVLPVRKRKIEQFSFPSKKEKKPSIPDVESVRKNGLAQLEDAIALLPDEDRAALLEARIVAPALFEEESPPIRFLRVEKWNAWAAAARLAKYWRTRTELFGKRAFLPMDQSGEGALTRDDIAILSTGYTALLKNDSEGRTVVTLDSARRINHSREPRMRCAFYVYSIVAQNDMSQEDGFVVIVILGKPTLDRTMTECGEMVLESLPIRLHSAHVTNCPSVSERKTFLGTLAPLMLRMMKPFMKERTHIHVSDTREELAASLAGLGIKPVSLPKCIGGEWGYEEFSRWQEFRLRYEWRLPACTTETRLQDIPEYTAKALADMSEEEKAERKRRMNVLHSRRRRERQRVEMEVFGEQAAELREKNYRLCQENKRLQDILQSAQRKVTQIEAETNVAAADDGARRVAFAQDERELSVSQSPRGPLMVRSFPPAANLSITSGALARLRLDEQLRQAGGGFSLNAGLPLSNTITTLLLRQRIMEEQLHQQQELLAARASLPRPHLVGSSAMSGLFGNPAAELGRGNAQLSSLSGIDGTLTAAAFAEQVQAQNVLASLLGLDESKDRDRQHFFR